MGHPRSQLRDPPRGSTRKVNPPPSQGASANAAAVASNRSNAFARSKPDQQLRQRRLSSSNTHVLSWSGFHPDVSDAEQPEPYWRDIKWVLLLDSRLCLSC